MAFRRRFRSRFRGFRGRPRRGGLRRPSEPTRWEVCNIWDTREIVVPNTGDTTTGVLLTLARIPAGLWDSLTVGSLRGLANATRFLELGGIVLQWGYEFSDPTLDLDVAPDDSATWLGTALMVDRANAGNPPGPTNNWLMMGATSAQPPFQPSVATAAEDTDLPTRILHRDTRRCDPNSWALIDPSEGALYAVNGQRVRGERTGQMNKRLKLRLDDKQQLCWWWQFYTTVAYAMGVSVAYRVWMNGTLYYRARF